MNKKNFLVLKTFVKFLQKNEVTSKYICNLHNQENTYKNNNNYKALFNKHSVEDPNFYFLAYGLICFAFSWKNSNEGEDFWYFLNIKWLETLYSLKEFYLNRLEEIHKID